MTPTITRLAGFDDEIVSRLHEDDRLHLAAVSACGVVSILLSVCGLGYAAHLALGGVVVPLLIALATGMVVANLVRLHHAGSGFPAHRPLDAIETHRPALVAVVVYLALGAMLTSPCAMWTLAPLLKRDIAAAQGSSAGIHDVPDQVHGLHRDRHGEQARVTGGLITRGRAFVGRPLLASVLTILFALVFSAVAWLKFFFLRAFRTYERERYVRERALIDRWFEDSQLVVVSTLAPYRTFTGHLRQHYADPPYNTVPTFFGVMPDELFKDARFVRPWDADDEGVSVADVARAEEEEPRAPPPSVVDAQIVEPAHESVSPLDDGILGAPADEPEARSVWDEPLVDDGGPPSIHYLDIGRLPVERARRHSDEVAPFIAAVTGRSLREVAALLRVAPDDTHVHQLFSEYKSLRAILMREAAFARDHGFTRLVSIIVGIPEDDVMRRIESAPPDQRLTGVFAPELAKRILRQTRC
jgi:hypothetical protein